MEIITIFINVIIPIFIIIGIGIHLHRRFKFDMNTLSKLNMYYLVPGLIFIRLYETTFSWKMFVDVLLFFILYCVILYIISIVIAVLLRFRKGVRLSFINCVLFYNTGNYGVPVNDLVFRQDPFAMSIQIIIMTFQNLFIYSFGIFNIQSAQIGKLKALIDYLKMPILYAMIGGIGLNIFAIKLPQFLHQTGTYVANALIGIALLTLGAQVAQLKFHRNLVIVYITVFTRLVIGPLLAYPLILLLQPEAIMAQALFIASAMPSAVTNSIIAQEYDNEPELAAQSVLATTFVSMITVTFAIFIAKMLFPS